MLEAILTTAALVAAQSEARPLHVESLSRELSALESEILEIEDRVGRSLDPELKAKAEVIRQEATYLRVKQRKHGESGSAGTGLSESEVAELRAAVARLRDDLRELDRPALDEPAAREIELPADSVFAARLLDPVSSQSAEVSDRIEAITTLPVTVHGDVVIPQGSRVFGVVELVDRAGRVDRTARLVLAFDRIEIEGRSHAITATAVGASEALETGVGSDRKRIGLGAGVGGVIGAVLAGGTGVVAGALLGSSGALFATEGKDVDLPEGTMLQLRLDRPLWIRRR
jgi:hypothetical protein